MLSSLLAEGDAANNAGSGWVTWVILAVFIVIIVVFFVISSRRNKKKQEETEQIMNAVKPGNKVKTIGGMCGIVVEVDPDENTFVLETGSETTGKCYMKFDKQAIYQTDAVVESSDDKKEDKKDEAEDKAEEPFEEASPAEETAAQPEEKTEEKAEEKAEEKSE
mgnify:CR=1 FL=1